MYQEPAPVQNPVPDDDVRPRNLTYEEYKSQNLPRYLPLHYTGSVGYANYGYLNVNGCWVDPDSKKEIHDAENDLLSAYHVPHLPIGIEPNPNLTEDQIYAAFVEEVSAGLDGDQEGDPRAMQITPAMFSRWAVGASRGDRYVVPEVAPQVSNSLRPSTTTFTLCHHYLNFHGGPWTNHSNR